MIVIVRPVDTTVGRGVGFVRTMMRVTASPMTQLKLRVWLPIANVHRLPIVSVRMFRRPLESAGMGG